MYKQIYLDAPNVGELEKRYLSSAIDKGYVSVIGPFVTEFEEKFAEYLGVKRAVSTQSGTSAIHIALHELGLGPGDEVIVPVLTFVATVNPVIYVGARPVPVDIDEKTWNISPEEIEKNITKKTRAVIPVHLYGNPCSMDEILEIAERRSLYVIEDATESLGAKYNGRPTGTFGDFGCFSFNGNKVITTGGGGMIVANNIQKIEHIKFLVNQARDNLSGCYHSEIGFNYRMTNLEAAIGLAQTRKLKTFLKKKKKINSIYREELSGINSISFPKEYDSAEASYWISCIFLEKIIDIDTFRHRLRSKGIPTRRIFMPLTEFPPYKGYKKTDYPNSHRVYDRGLCLPSSTVNSDENIYKVCKTIKKFIHKG